MITPIQYFPAAKADNDTKRLGEGRFGIGQIPERLVDGFQSWVRVTDATDAAALRNAFPSEVRNRVGAVVGKMIATVELNFMV